ncbi:PstS family phosphate ABC transporter substrate-binding protein [Rheinheimera sp. UJ63]|uniref:PstS family phosphate ABC transporter substrate-binding protein n=1 Tax=Rheinheimera sp. UJ63 TaxID=2910157 RepID=UPI001F215A25|nr:phosphate ABC transporter substrate-binding protein [Rheinheimera sp. UJ63]MCF4008370.1 phosphate ABC transporter substrate-binding protein [Rheinheimera sp. UJ63]
MDTLRMRLSHLCSVLLLVTTPFVCSTETRPNNVSQTASLTGTLSSTGSDTLHNMMMVWRREFVLKHPQLNIQIQSSGSATAPVALVEGTANLGPMSRVMLTAEQDRFRRRFGYEAYAVPVALDMLAIYVHQDNPLQQISMAQLEAIFSQNRRCALHPAITRWGDLGLAGRWQQRSIAAYGRNPASGTYAFFRQKALCNDDFQQKVAQLAGAAAVVRSVSLSENGLGYSGVGQQIAGVKMLAISQGSEQAAIMPSPENALSGAYPLARLLYIYVNKAPNQPLAAAEREFFRFILSAAGQQLLESDGLVPIPLPLRQQVFEDLGL